MTNMDKYSDLSELGSWTSAAKDSVSGTMYHGCGMNKGHSLTEMLLVIGSLGQE